MQKWHGTRSNKSISGQGESSFSFSLTLINALLKNPLLNGPFDGNNLTTLGKAENAGNSHFMPFPHCFLSYQRKIQSFEQHKICCLQTIPILSHLQFCWRIKRRNCRFTSAFLWNTSSNDNTLVLSEWKPIWEINGLNVVKMILNVSQNVRKHGWENIKCWFYQLWSL